MQCIFDRKRFQMSESPGSAHRGETLVIHIDWCLIPKKQIQKRWKINVMENRCYVSINIKPNIKGKECRILRPYLLRASIKQVAQCRTCQRPCRSTKQSGQFVNFHHADKVSERMEGRMDGRMEGRMDGT